jgi:hypothetical protein
MSIQVNLKALKGGSKKWLETLKGERFLKRTRTRYFQRTRADKNQKAESPPLTFYTVADKSVIVHSGGEVCSGALKGFGGKSRL